MELKEAIAELRKNEKLKFDQTVDLIVNLKGVDMKRDSVNTIITLPARFKDKKVFGFLTKKSAAVESISKEEFGKYKDAKELKKLIKRYDAFIAVASVMPSVATTFGKVLGPTGKMPSPQLGIIMQETDDNIKKEIEKISRSVKIKMKEPSIKVSVGKESMKDEDLIKNIEMVYAGIVNVLPTKRENVRSALIKLTMSKPIKVEIK